MEDPNSSRRSLLRKIGAGVVSVPFLSGVGSARSVKEPDKWCRDERGDFYVAVGDEQDEDDPIDYDVKIVSGREGEEERPMTVEVSITNELDSMIAIGDVQEAFFYGHMSKEQSFILLPKDVPEEYYSHKNGRWVLEKGYWVPEKYDMLQLEPGETESRQLYVLHTNRWFRNWACFDYYPEEIRFPPTSCYVHYMVGGHRDVVEWGFTLEERSLIDIIDDDWWHPPRYDQVEKYLEDKDSDLAEAF